MEAIEFLKETERMCSSYKECTDCPLKELASFAGYKACRIYMLNECEKAISAVDSWSKEHQIITNAKKFEEVFDLSGYRLITESADWWDEPYKEPGGRNEG